MDGDNQAQAHPHQYHPHSVASRDVAFPHVLQDAPFAMVLTDPQGHIRRVVCPAQDLGAQAKQAMLGEHISVLFSDGEQPFLDSVFTKLSEHPTFSLENIPVTLNIEDSGPVYLSLSPVENGGMGAALISWHFSRDQRHRGEEDQDSEARRLRQRIQLLEARLESHRRRADRAVSALESLRVSNRIISNALSTTRELKRQQSQSLRQMISVRDELIERTRDLHTSAIEARVAADEARYRLRFLADASWVLSETLDVRQTLQKLAELIVPLLTECCVVHLVDSDGDIMSHAVVACRETAVQERIEEHPRCDVRNLDTRHPLRHVLSTGHPSVIHGLDEDGRTWDDGDDTFLDHAAECGITACIVSPLRSRDRMLGTLALASTRPGHRYLPEDLQFAEDLALRVGQALDNAMLFQAVADATKDRERYLSMASHELRSPLAVVSGFGSLLLRYIEQPELDRERIISIGKEMQQGIERLEILTSNLLASATIDAQAAGMHRRRVDLARLVLDLVERMRVTLESGEQDRIEVIAESPVFGRWNVEGVERAVTNVLSNALKYSDASTPVHVEVMRDNDDAVVEVRDLGIGMTDAEMAELFTPFARGKEARATALGTGLGMYITQQIVRQHGGRVQVESQPGEGTSVIIRLPIEPEGHGVPMVEEPIDFRSR